jgi:hypothetical protein
MRRSLTVVIGTVLVLLAAGPAWSQSNDGDDDLVVVNGPVHVPADDVVDELVLVHGTVLMDGTVRGDLVAFDADVTITGTVEGDVTVFRGHVRLTSTARIGGDLSARDPEIAEGATVVGERKGAPLIEISRGFRRVARFAIWVAVSVSMLLLGIILLALAPRAFEAIDAAARTAVGSAIGWGLAVLVGLPIAAVLALVTLVGIPLGIGVLLALAPLFSAGYVVSTWLLGRLLVRPPGRRFLALLAGWAILRALALIPVLGGLLWFAATVFGLGSIVVAMWRARTGPTFDRRSAVEAGPPPPAPPSP